MALTLKQQAIQNLRDFKEAADYLGIRFMIMEGTLFGAYREKDFMPDDEDDIDIGIKEKYFHKVETLIDLLKKQRFEHHKRVEWEGKFHGGAIERGGNHIDIMRMIKDGDTIYNIGNHGALRYDYPAHLFDGYGKIKFHGIEVETPQDIEGYLTTRYGDWRVHVDRSVYNYASPIFSPNVKHQ